MSLKDTLNRFTLRGPDTCSILQRVLAPSAVTSSNSSAATCVEDQAGGLWWQSYYSDSKRKDGVMCNESAWLQLRQSQGACSSNLALPLIVRDPRVMLPTKRAKIHHSVDGPSAPPPLASPSVVPGSALFDAGVRRCLLHSRYTDHQINEQRFLLEPRNQLLELNDNEARIPVLLLLTAAQYKGDSCWNLIVPGGWGSSTWLSLVYSGAVAIGTDSETHFVLEQHTSPPHYLLPDTVAGRHYSQTLAVERKNKYFRMPPDKRENYVKMGVHHPFHSPWMKLLDSLEHLPDMKAVSSGKIGTGFMDEVLAELGMNSTETTRGKSVDKCTENICVMRNPRYLRTLDFVTCRSGSRRRLFRGLDNVPADNTMEVSSPNTDASVDTKSDQAFRQQNLEEAADTLSVVRLTCQKQLLRVMITIIGSGTIDPCAMICIPTAADIASLECKLMGQCKPSVGFADGILEQKHEDVNEQERKLQRKAHQKDLARLRRRRKAARAGARDEHSQSLTLVGQSKEGALASAMKAAVQKVNDELHDVVKRSSSYLSSNQQLWLVPEDAPLQQCSRLLIGYVTEANFSRVRGCSAGQGFVVTGALLPLLQRRLRLWQRDEMGEEKPCKRLRLDSNNSPSDDGFCDSNLPLITDNGIVVLIRNTQTLQYRFGLLTLCEKQPPP